MFEQNRNAHLIILTAAEIITGSFATSADITAALKANRIPGVTDFGYDHELDVQRRGKGQFGLNKPVGLTDEYGGIKGSFDVEGFEGEKAALAAMNGKARADFFQGNYNKLRDLFFLAWTTANDGAPLNTHFCDTCMIDGVPKKISGDAKRFSFQGVYGRDFLEKSPRIHVFDGAATPVTACNFASGEVPVQWEDEDGTDRFALLVLKYDDATGFNKRILPGASATAGYYTETATGITLAAADGLAEGNKLLVVYLV